MSIAALPIRIDRALRRDTNSFLDFTELLEALTKGLVIGVP